MGEKYLMGVTLREKLGGKFESSFILYILKVLRLDTINQRGVSFN